MDSYVKVAYAVIVAGAALDCITTFLALSVGCYETSPFLRPLFYAGDLHNVLYFQLGLVPAWWFFIYQVVRKLDRFHYK